MTTLSDTCDAALAAAERARADSDWQGGAAQARAALDAAAALDDPARLLAARRLLALHLAHGGRPDEAATVALAALPQADSAGPPETAIDLRLTLSMIYFLQVRPAQALPYASQAVELAQALDQPGLLSWSLNRLGVIYNALGHRERSIELLDLAVREAERDGGDEVRFAAYFNLATKLVADLIPGGGGPAHAAALRERGPPALASARRAAALAGQRARHLVNCADFECAVLARMGRADELEAAATALESAIARSPLVGRTAKVAVFRAHALLLRGRAQEAYELLEGRVDPSQAQSTPADRNWWLEARYLSAKQTGRFEQALLALEELLQFERQRNRELVDAQWQGLLTQTEVKAAHVEASRMRQAADKLEHVAQEASHAARHDPLTGLANRRALDEQIGAWLRQGPRQTPWYAAMFDIDHFKGVNDHFGHHGGDEVLRQFGQLLADAAGPADLVARNGGEEFVALLAPRPAGEARAWCEEVCERMRATRWPRLADDAMVTVSAGVTAARPDDDARSLMRRADQALYRAKDLGRDRVVDADVTGGL